MARWPKMLCIFYKQHSVSGFGHNFLNCGGKMCIFIPYITNPVHNKIPNVFPIGLSFHGKSFCFIMIAINVQHVLFGHVYLFHMADQQEATLTGGNVMLWPRFLPPVLSSPSLLRAITVKCVHRWSNVLSLQSKLWDYCYNGNLEFYLVCKRC